MFSRYMFTREEYSIIIFRLCHDPGKYTFLTWTIIAKGTKGPFFIIPIDTSLIQKDGVQISFRKSMDLLDLTCNLMVLSPRGRLLVEQRPAQNCKWISTPGSSGGGKGRFKYSE